LELRLRRIITSIDTSLSSVLMLLLWRTRRSLEQESAVTLVYAFVTSRVNYCKTLLADVPKVMTDKLQRMLSASLESSCSAASTVELHSV